MIASGSFLIRQRCGPSRRPTRPDCGRTGPPLQHVPRALARRAPRFLSPRSGRLRPGAPAARSLARAAHSVLTCRPSRQSGSVKAAILIAAAGRQSNKKAASLPAGLPARPRMSLGRCNRLFLLFDKRLPRARPRKPVPEKDCPPPLSNTSVNQSLTGYTCWYSVLFGSCKHSSSRMSRSRFPIRQVSTSVKSSKARNNIKPRTSLCIDPMSFA